MIHFKLHIVVLAMVSTMSAQSGLPDGRTLKGVDIDSLPDAQKRKVLVLSELGKSTDIQNARDPAARLQTESLVKARESVFRDDLSKAEDYLTVLSPFEPGSANWHLDAATRWLLLSDGMTGQVDRARSRRVTSQMLQRTREAETLARAKGDLRLASAAKSMEATILLRYVGDPAAALIAYREASAANPQDTAIREAMTKLERSLKLLQTQAKNRKQ